MDDRKPTTDSRELNVVKECRTLYFLLWQITHERKDYYLWQHCLKSVISIGSNLAEGNKRRGKEQLRFIEIAEGSMAEFEFQYSLLNLDAMPNYDMIHSIDDIIDKIKAMMFKLRRSVVSGRI